MIFHSIPFRTEEIRVIVSEDHPLAQFDSLTLEQIRNEPIATTEVIAPRITQAFETINCEPNFYLRTAFKRTAISGVPLIRTVSRFCPVPRMN